jgi:ribonuclease R
MTIDLEEVLSALHRVRGKGLSLKELAGQLHLGQGARQELRRGLSRLLKEGRALFDGHRYREANSKREEPSPAEKRPALPRKAPAVMALGASRRRGVAQKAGEVTGVIHLKTEGYGFVTPLLGEGGRENDLFIPPQFVKGALDGDVVRARTMKGRDGRLAGEVLEVVERRRQLVLGIYQARAQGTWVVPHDRSLTESIVVLRHPKARDGEMVKVRLHREAHGPLQGEVIAVLGNRGDPRFEILATAYAEGFSDEFDPATALAAESVPDHVHPEEIGGRRDLRHLPLVTIDGEDARDFDDAVHASVSSSGYRLVVAIADVAHYVRPGGPLDREALRRATSVYFPGTVLPMLPERLSNGICSLNPDVDRLCMVCDIALDKQGRPLHADLYEAVMRSHARLTYTRVAAALSGEADAELRPLLDDLRVAQELAKQLTARRRERGSIDFDLPESKIVLDDEGRVAEIVRRPRNDAHRLIEEFMLAANEAVARFFDVRGLPTVYRIHDVPDREKLESFAALARTHGFDLPEDLTPQALNEFLKKVEGKPAQKALNSLLLRAMMQAQYSPDNIGHYGLAAPHYLHFTSPIRRYPDLMVHRLLKEHWARGGQPLREHEREEQEAYLAGVAAQCSDRERAAMKAERDVVAFYSALYMQDKIGEKHLAVVSGVAEFGLFCELEDLFVEGLVPAESLGEGVKLDKALQRLVVGASGKSYGVGDEVQIEVVSADPARRRITLALAGKVAGAEKWLKPEDVEAKSPASKPRPKGQAKRAPHPPPRGSSRGQSSRRGRRRGGGR